MSTSNSEPQDPRRMDLTFGREATTAELRKLLLAAPPSFLEGAVDNPAMGEEEVLLLLRNRTAGAVLLARIGKDRRWSASYAVKKAVARHPHTPPMISRSLLGHLHWGDLADLSEDPRIAPPVRRQAESQLRGRIPELALGERVALARRAGREVIGKLLRSSDGGVLLALFGNPKLTDHDAEAIAERHDAPPDALRHLAEHPRWGRLAAVRGALARNPGSPIPIALRLVSDLPEEELIRVLDDERTPTIVRVSADRRREELGTKRREENESG